MTRKSRHIIYAQDIMNITGRSRRYSYRVLKMVRRYFNKADHQLVTVEEYAEFHGIPLSKVMEYID